jgi:hypothetical protein
MTTRELHNAMAAQRSIDGWELPAHWSQSTIRAYLRQPYEFFLRSDDHRQKEIWQIIERRQPK